LTIDYLETNIWRICDQSNLLLLPELQKKIAKLNEEHPDIAEEVMYKTGQVAGHIPYSWD